MAFQDFKEVIQEKIDFGSMSEKDIDQKIEDWYSDYSQDPLIIGYYSFVEEWFPEEEFSKENDNHEFHLKL